MAPARLLPSALLLLLIGGLMAACAAPAPPGAPPTTPAIPTPAPGGEGTPPAAPAPTPTAAPSDAAAGARIAYEVVPAESEARYRVREQLVGVNLPSDAVGTTRAITGVLGTHLKTRRPVVVYSVSGQPAWEGKTDGVSGANG
jgi:hypothetical protein